MDLAAPLDDSRSQLVFREYVHVVSNPSLPRLHVGCWAVHMSSGGFHLI